MQRGPARMADWHSKLITLFEKNDDMGSWFRVGGLGMGLGGVFTAGQLFEACQLFNSLL